MTEGIGTPSIPVSQGVLERFHSIMAETKMEANDLMEHFFSLYQCCVKLVQPLQKESGSAPVGTMVKNEMPEDFVSEGTMTDGDSSDVAILGYSIDTETTVKPLKDNDKSSPTLLSTLSALSGQGTLSDPVLAFQSLLALYRRDDTAGSRKYVPKRIMPSHYIPVPCETRPEDVLKKVMCSLCQATFDRFTDLLAHHKATHNADLSHPLRCRACGRTQTSEAGLVHHQIYVCKMVERPHTCEVCTLKFQSEEMVWVHKCSGDVRKRFACEFCDHYKTESSSDLEKHMRIHTGDKCFRCETCGFQTAWKKNLKEHLVKHSGLKPFSCPLCGYSTADRHNLRAHALKHGKDEHGHDQGPGLDCSLCGLSFGSCHALRAHKDAHISSSDKPYKCGACEYRARYRSVLHVHQVRHNHLRQHGCPACGQLFAEHRDLLQHQASVHGQLPAGVPPLPGLPNLGQNVADNVAEMKTLTTLTTTTTSATPAERQPAFAASAKLCLAASGHQQLAAKQQHLQSQQPQLLQNGGMYSTMSSHVPLQQQPPRSQQVWKGQPHADNNPLGLGPGPAAGTGHPIMPTSCQGLRRVAQCTPPSLLAPAPGSLSGFQQPPPPSSAAVCQNIAMQSFGFSPWPRASADLLGLGPSATDSCSLLRQGGGRGPQAGPSSSSLSHPPSFVACPLPVFPGLGDPMAGAGIR